MLGARVTQPNTFPVSVASLRRPLASASAIALLSLVGSLAAHAQQSASGGGQVRAISEAEFASAPGGNDWLFEDGIGSSNYDYTALTASPIQGVPTYISPANAPAPTDASNQAQAAAPSAPSALPATASPIRAPLQDLGGTVAAVSSSISAPPKGSVPDAAFSAGQDYVQASAGALKEVIAGADAPALPAYLNPDNAPTGAAASAAGAVDPFPALPGASSLPDLPAFPGADSVASSSSVPVQSIGAAPLPPSLNADVSESAAVRADGFDPYAFVDEQSAVLAAQQTPEATIADQNSPLSDLPALPELGEVTVNTDQSQNARSANGEDGDLAFLEQRLASAGVADEDLVVQIGGQVTYRPDYIGSDEHEFMVLPVVDIEYLDRFFISTDRGVGVKVLDNDAFDFSVHGTWRRGRSNVDNQSDLDGGIVLGGEAGFSTGPFRFSVDADYGVTGDIGGLKGNVEASMKQGFGEAIVEVYGGAQFGDSQYITDQFGFDHTAYAGATNPPGAYEADAGLVDIHGGVAMSYFVTPNFAINVDGKVSQLMGDAGESYIVEELGSKTQYQGSIGGTYKF